jgi:hypothetical protein
MKGRGAPENPNAEGANGDSAPQDAQWKGTVIQGDLDKWSKVQDGHKHFAKDNDGTSGGLSVAVKGPSFILCQACLIQCEGECIHITDDTGTKYVSIYK